MPNSGSAPMGQQTLRNIFDLIEMHEHLDDPGPQLTFKAEKELLEEVLLLRRLINREKGYNLPIPVSVYGTPLPETFSAAEQGNPYLEVTGEVPDQFKGHYSLAWNQTEGWDHESQEPFGIDSEEDPPSNDDIRKVFNKTIFARIAGPLPDHTPPTEEPKGSAIHDRARQFLEANPEEAAYWRRMHNRTSEDIIQQGPVPVEVQIKSALWELRKQRAAGATDEEAVAALFEANSVEELGQLMRFFQDKEPKSVTSSKSVPSSGMSSWGDNPGLKAQEEAHDYWGSEEATPEEQAAYEARTSCGEVDASADDFTNSGSEEPHAPSESPGFAAMRDYLQTMYREWQEVPDDESADLDEHFYLAARNMMAHYLGGESGEARPYGPSSKAHQDATAIAQQVSPEPAKAQEEPARDEYASVPITVARMVHYVSYGTPGGEYGSECRAAVVSGVRANDFYPQVADLVVLNPTGVFFNNKSLQSEAEYTGGTWHYPMQCRNNATPRDSRE